MKSNFLLIGFQASGKTTLGKLAASKMGRVFIDTDLLIEKNHPKLSCREITMTYGEIYFRNLEKKAVNNLQNERNCIIASGGGTLLIEENVSMLKQHSRFIYLQVDKNLIKERIWERPTLPSYLDPQDPEHSFSTIFDQRIALYEKHADIVLSTSDLTIEESSHALVSVIRKNSY